MTPFRSLSALVLACVLAVSVQASPPFNGPAADIARLASHRGLAHRRSVADGVSPARARRSSSDNRRCRQREVPASTATSASSSSSPTPTPETLPEQTNNGNNSPPPPPEQNNNSNNSPPPDGNANGVSGSVSGLINVVSNCGDIGATREVTPTSGPNGNIDWLNCGLTGGGWNPPYVRIDDLVTADLTSDGPFAACSGFFGYFYNYGGQYGIPPIMLAAFAMQESSCRPNTVGQGGEQGLMQLTWDKCGDAPGGNCQDPDYNIRTGAAYFASELERHNGNVLLAAGQYNGWNIGLTYAQATAALHSSCCRCQNNADYLHQFFNGWLQNIDAYTVQPPLGKYFNLNECP